MTKSKISSATREVMEEYASEVHARQDSDDPADWLEIGRIYADGIGVERDEQIAAKWYRKAANAGSIDAMIRLSFVLDRKWSSQEERAESIQWLRRAADLGSGIAMLYLGIACREGRNMSVDFDEAAKWFIKAYHAGELFGAHCVGALFSKNREKHADAVKWLKIATEDDHDPSCISDLAMIFGDVHSSQFNPTEAFKSWSRVADCSTERLRYPAMLAMANCYRSGIGTTPDRREAIRLLDRLLSEIPEGSKAHRQADKLRQEISGEFI